jgi:CheY-like chemotaxis protein
MTIKLLVADDSATIQKVVSLAFSDEDVIIETVSSGYAAMNSARIFKPDVVLADVLMPGGSGYEVCERIKQDPELAGTPVILMVGALESFDEVEASRVKCDGHLTKPFDTSELIQTVHSLVEKRTVLHKDEAPVEPTARPVLPHAPSMQNMNDSIAGFASLHVLNSFLGSDRILDLFEPEMLTLAQTELLQKTDIAGAASLAAPKDQYSEAFVKLVVDRVVRQVSQDVIREIAWEVVPELSEILLRRFIEERQKA